MAAAYCLLQAEVVKTYNYLIILMFLYLFNMTLAAVM